MDHRGGELRRARRVRVSVTVRQGMRGTFGTRGGGSPVRGQLRWKTGTVLPGARRTYTITTRLRPNARLGRYVNRATADGDNARPTSGRGSTALISGG